MLLEGTIEIATQAKVFQNLNFRFKPTNLGCNEYIILFFLCYFDWSCNTLLVFAPKLFFLKLVDDAEPEYCIRRFIVFEAFRLTFVKKNCQRGGCRIRTAKVSRDQLT